ncbi:MAG TPA: TIGR03618 family F420-dependent PPOX class oxidoreductase [Ktedonobacterales bacterium]|nr:TIGR03618 family F420-dependent PPOX class oxidoreductase [Ktedonobacterales bacterium]
MPASLATAVRAFLDEVHFGTLATVNRQGIPSQVLVWYMLDGNNILVSTPADSYKVRNLRANRWASLSVSEGSRYVTVRGRTTIDEDPERGIALYRQIATRYLGAEAAEQWLAQASRRGAADRFTLRLSIEHVTGTQR